MSRVRDVPCSGGCGQLVWRGKGCLPPGQSKCQQCRRAARQRPCAACGTTFTPPDKKRTTCSLTCRSVRFAEVQAIGVAAARSRRRPDPQCEVCGKAYRPTDGRQQRTCGRLCGAVINARNARVRLVSQAPRPPVMGTCAGCGREEESPPWRVVCSLACAKARRNAIDRAARAAEPTQRSCPCGVSISAARRRCDPCIAASRDRRKRAERSRRRLLELAESEPYTLEEIAKRDGFRCGICRKKVPMVKVVPHPLAPTIDHLVPVSHHGDDTKVNVQLAHFLCNSRRRTGGVVQLALIG